LLLSVNLVNFNHPEINPFFLKIVIAGAGEIGLDLAKVLTAEKHDVTIIERDDDAKKLARELNVRLVEGNATSSSKLREAGVATADIMIAVTSDDGVNMIASMAAKKMGCPKVIGRIREMELSGGDCPLEASDLGMDVKIHPEEEAANEIVMLLKRTVASDIVEIADGSLQVIGIRLPADAPVIGQTIRWFDEHHPEIDFNVIALNRKGNTLMAKGDHKLLKDDQLFALARKDDIPKLIETTGRKETNIDDVLIAGGSGVGEMIIHKITSDPELSKRDWNIKLLEPNEDRANELANRFPNVRVLFGEPTNPDILAIEGIGDMDAFLAVTDDEESNIISCLMAKHLGVSKTVALISKKEYIPISQTIGLDAAVNTKLAASNEIHRHIRGGNVKSITSLHGITADVIEMEVSPGSKVDGKAIKKVSFPGGAVVGAIWSGEASDAEIVTGNSIMKAGDRVMLFAQASYLDRLTDLFQG